ncbi:MAG: hypothetical protein V7647_1153 [Acidobacteriota bacterium]
MAKRASGKKRAGGQSASRGARTKTTRGAARSSRPKTARTSGTRASSKRSSAKRSSAKRPVAKRSSAKRSSAKRAGASTPKARRASAAVKPKTSGRRGTAGRKASPGTPSTQSTIGTAVRGVVAGAVAAVVDNMPWSSDAMDAIELLEADHRRMEDLLAQGEETTERGVKVRTELLRTLTRELNAHELIEEKVLYPALQSHPQAKDIVLEGYQEHHVADLIVQELHGLARSDEQWGPKFKVLKENIEHHIKEEEGEMFRTARGIFSREELQQLGAVMAKMKAGGLAAPRR